MTGGFTEKAQKALKHAISENKTVNYAVLELNALKFACNASFEETCAAIVPVLMELIDKEDILESIKKKMGKWARVLTKFCHTVNDQVTVLDLIREYLSENTDIVKSIGYILPLFYRIDVLDEEAILQWWSAVRNNEDAFEELLMKEAQPFINFLELDDSDE